MDSGFEAQFNHFIEVMLTPVGALGLLIFIGLSIAALVSPRLRWVCLTLLLWVATLAFIIRPGERVARQLAFPLDTLRAEGRPICVALLAALVIPSLIASRGWRRHAVSGALVLFFIFEMLFAMRIVAAGVTGRGLASLVIYPLMFIVLGIGLGRWLQDWSNARTAIRCIVGAGLLFLVGTCYQLIVNRAPITHSNRMSGTTGNPQHAALLISLSLPAFCYLIARKEEAKIVRLGLSAAVGFLVLFLLWTGSRTGIALTLIGVALLFRARIGRLFGVVMFAGAFVLLALQIYKESTLAFSDMFLRGDTRSRVWASMYREFLDAPAFGGMSESFGVSESSYLSLAANAGLFGLIPFLVAMSVAAWGLLKLQRVRRHLGEHTMFADLVTASLVAIAVGGLFEGHLLGTLTHAVFCIYIYLNLLRFALDAAEVAALAPEAGAEYHPEYSANGEGTEHVPAGVGAHSL